MYKRAVASFWTVEEVDLSQDLRDWHKLNGALSSLLQIPCCCISPADKYLHIAVNCKLDTSRGRQMI